MQYSEFLPIAEIIVLQFTKSLVVIVLKLILLTLCKCTIIWIDGAVGILGVVPHLAQIHFVTNRALVLIC